MIHEFTSHTNDAIGRVSAQQLPDGRRIGFRYDADSRIAGITPPQRGEHAFTYDAVGQLTRYAPPSLPGVSRVDTRYSYGRSRQMSAVDRPDGQSLSAQYDSSTGLLTDLRASNIINSYTHDPASPSSLAAPTKAGC